VRQTLNYETLVGHEMKVGMMRLNMQQAILEKQTWICYQYGRKNGSHGKLFAAIKVTEFLNF
jgi:hypothetical protein